MVIFCADESAGDGELAGTSVSIPRGSRASSLWATAKVGAVTKAVTRKDRKIICMCCSVSLDRDFRHSEPTWMLRFSRLLVAHALRRAAKPLTAAQQGKDGRVPAAFGQVKHDPRYSRRIRSALPWQTLARTPSLIGADSMKAAAVCVSS